MSYEGPKSKPKPIAITRLNQDIPEYYSSVLGASIATGISRNALTEAAITGKRIRKGKGEGYKVQYRNAEDENKRLKQYAEFKSKKELAAFGLASTTEALSELKRLRTIERYCNELQKQNTALVLKNSDLKRLLNLERGTTYGR